ncbi:unnamed protein product [Polarella glacialis]|uniref:Endonuclease/exonuclease/phosphatase domain-containing protein n=1 Tax=Polarella glacialis TaxID=89957 RepID=A0A813KN98_POLGL|nr:unnamed protein product [Polarella glacialis]
MEPCDGSPEAGTLCVATLNLCILSSGITNRHLPTELLLGSSLFAALAWALLWSLGAGLRTLCLAAPVLILAAPQLGVACARCLAPLWWLLGFNDFKRERIDALLELLAVHEDLRQTDVLCVQECYGALLWDGGFPERLTEGARGLGFVHVVRSVKWPDFPAALAQNSGLLILSKRPIVKSSSLTFGISVEAANVNRGALHAELQGGLHIFTCHVSPAASVTGSGLAKLLLTPLFDHARRRQAQELADFIGRCAPRGEPVVLAGDLNLDLSFNSNNHNDNNNNHNNNNKVGAQLQVQPSEHAVHILSLLKDQCGLVDATSQTRCTPNAGLEGPPVLRHFRPTFGHTGARGLPQERWLTSLGDGTLREKGDDAILSRGLVVREVAEDELLMHESRRPRPEVAFISDHWAVRARLTLNSQEMPKLQ